MPPYHLIVLDWDGTLVDSEGYIVASFQRALQDLGLPPLPYAMVRGIIGLGLIEACEVLLPEHSHADRQFVADRYCHHYFVGSEKTPPQLFPGVQETLSWLCDNGYLLAVATGKGRRGLDRSLRETGLSRFFHATRCADETRSKPDPQMLLEILAELQLPAARAIMVGDTEYDLEMAHRAAMDRVAVTYGAHEVASLRRWDPLVCLEEFSGLRTWLAGSAPVSSPISSISPISPRSTPCL